MLTVITSMYTFMTIIIIQILDFEVLFNDTSTLCFCKETRKILHVVIPSYLELNKEGFHFLWEKAIIAYCKQQRFRQARTSAQSCQNLRYLLM